MDANELAMIAYDVMPGGIMTETGKGEMFGVLKMALHTLEAQYEALLAEADNEAAEARRLVAAQISTPLHSHSEFEELRKERDGWKTKHYDTEVKLEMMRQERDANEAESRRFQQTIVELEAENARLHRSLEERMSAQIPGAVKVVRPLIQDETGVTTLSGETKQPTRIHYAATQPGQLET